MYYSAPKCLYRGEYKRGMNGDGVSCSTAYDLCCIASPFARSWTSPFIVPRRGPGYMYRRQSRGRKRYGALTYSRPPYRRGLEPSCLRTLMMITRAPESRSYASFQTSLYVARLYVVAAAPSEWLGCRQSSPDPSWERNMSTRGSGAM